MSESVQTKSVSGRDAGWGPGIKSCSADGCDRPSAYRTTTRPGWCQWHADEIFRRAGLEPLTPIIRPSVHRRTRCLTCACESDYNLDYVLDKQSHGESPCRACFWRDWASSRRANLASWGEPVAATDLKEVRRAAEAAGYQYISALTDPCLLDDPHLVECLACGRRAVGRPGDISSMCQCRKSAKRQQPVQAASDRRTGRRKKDLFKDSGRVAVGWWDHDINEPSLWERLTVLATTEVTWKCPHCGGRFKERVRSMADGPGCPACDEKRAAETQARHNRMQTMVVADVPELLAAWDDPDDPATAPLLGSLTVRASGYVFRCPKGHRPRLRPVTYLESGCPHCRGQRSVEEIMDGLTASGGGPRMNAEIASQWHPTRNGSANVNTVPPGSRRKFSWRDESCGFEWNESVKSRDSGERLRCPKCRTILDSLAYHDPELGAEWSPDNPVSAWHVRPTGQLTFTPRWVCSTNAGHVWTAPLPSRYTGSGCPECRVSGKSAVEVAHRDAVASALGSAASGPRLHDPAFTRGSWWSVDILAELPGGHQLAIEYDGAYWHANKMGIDRAKSLDLLDAGLLVARLREHPLPSLEITTDRYREFSVYSDSPDPHGVIAAVLGWAVSGRD